MADVLELAKELADVTRLVKDDDVSSTLNRFVSRVVLTVPDCDEAAVAVMTSDETEIVAMHQRDVVGETQPSRAGLELQLVADGPLRESLVYGEPKRIGDLASDYRWPEFAAAAINAGYRSCLILPIPTAGGHAAAFSLFSRKPDAFSDTSYDVVLLFALNAGVAFDNVQLYHDSTKLVEQLRTALGTRTVIGQAQGILMQRFSITADTAFTVLTRASQNTNVRLRALALELVDAQNQGFLAAKLREYGLSAS
jgi:GAF domain-containing protein